MFVNISGSKSFQKVLQTFTATYMSIETLSSIMASRPNITHFEEKNSRPDV